jgi:hypothetical protein
MITKAHMKWGNAFKVVQNRAGVYSQACALDLHAP